MNVRNCVKCGKIFNYAVGKPICPTCKKDMDDVFDTTRQFIRKNPEASIVEVSETCNVDVKQIREWVREERLSFSKNSDIGIECEACGKTIKTGRYCEECKGSLVKDLKSVGRPEPKVEENPFAKKQTDTKMRFMNKDMR